jgi:hypothetical protein
MQYAPDGPIMPPLPRFRNPGQINQRDNWPPGWADPAASLLNFWLIFPFS